MQQSGGLKAFFGRPVGKAVLAILSLLTLLGSFLYLGPLLAIPTFLLFGIALPIYMGWRRIRDLAILGLVVLIVASPIATAAEVQQFRVPAPAATSDPSLPYGNGGSVLSQAVVTPYTGAPGGTYNFSMVVNPQYVPANASPLLWLTLYVSTCPGATGNNSPYCSAGYPFIQVNHSLPANLTKPTLEWFSVVLGQGPQIWWWQASTAYHTTTNLSSTLVSIFLYVPSFGGQQGPVTGSFTATFGIVFIPILEGLFLYAGTVFFLALLVYLFFRNRRERRGAASAPPAPPGGPGASSPSGSAPAPTTELKCPNCQALVYPNETSCWKCGAPLTGNKPTPSSAPLPPGPSS